MDGRRGDAPTEFCMEEAFITGVSSYGLHPCLYCIVPTGLVFVLFYKTFWALGCVWVDVWRLSCFTRHFGRHLGITNKFVLLSACSKIGRMGR